MVTKGIKYKPITAPDRVHSFRCTLCMSNSWQNPRKLPSYDSQPKLWMGDILWWTTKLPSYIKHVITPSHTWLMLAVGAKEHEFSGFLSNYIDLRYWLIHSRKRYELLSRWDLINIKSWFCVCYLHFRYERYFSPIIAHRIMALLASRNIVGRHHSDTEWEVHVNLCMCV